MSTWVVDADEGHARALIGSLRIADRMEIQRAGYRPGRAVMQSWRASTLRRALIVDDSLAGVFGVSGPLLGGVGMPWFLTTPAIERAVPVAIARIYREQVAEMLRMFDLLENYVDATYTAAVRLLALSGFHLDEPAPFGPHGALFRRFELRASKWV